VPRILPANPSLEHLKNQAKDLLCARQQERPDAQLAEAQHAIAREYGFASWPKLKAHVEKPSPLAGRWTANVARSKRHPLNLFQSATMQFDVAGSTITITDIVSDESGRENRGTNTIQADGKEHSADRHGYSVAARWTGRLTLEATATQNGARLGGVTYQLSPDEKTMTVADAGGAQLIVFERS
jgi:hypothetical protein